MNAMPTRRLWPVLSLVPLGMVAGHQVADAVASAGAGGSAHDHGHLGPLAAVGLLLAVGAAGALVRRVSGAVSLPSVAMLAGAQIAAFSAMETAERLAAGGDVGALARSPTLWVGLGAQAGVALALVVGLRAARRRAGALLLLRAPDTFGVVLVPVTAAAPARALVPRPVEATRWLLLRGPPAVGP